MLTIGYAVCDKCKTSFLDAVQYATKICSRCDAEYTRCDSCQIEKCPKCRGNIETEQERLARQGIRIIY